MDELTERLREALLRRPEILAKLTFTRPGWCDYLRTIAESLSGADMFDEFVRLGPDEMPEEPPGAPAQDTWPPRFSLQVRGVVGLWARNHQLAVTSADLEELIACLRLDPSAEVRP